jgi:hypothetical protein
MADRKYEEKKENFDEIPVASRRSESENNLLEFLKLREEVENHFKEIREKKRRIQELIGSDPSLKEVDTRIRKVPRELDAAREEKAKKRKMTVDQAQETKEKNKKKIKNAQSRKRKEHRDYLRQGYTMTESEIAKEGGEVERQYTYFKDLGDGKSSTHVIKGIGGLKLSSQLGEEMSE